MTSSEELTNNKVNGDVTPLSGDIENCRMDIVREIKKEISRMELDFMREMKKEMTRMKQEIMDGKYLVRLLLADMYLMVFVLVL